MTTITNITPTFYDSAITFGRKTASISVVASSWSVKLSNDTEKKYNITLSLDNLDPKYSSDRDDPLRTLDDYFIQIDDDPETFDNHVDSVNAFRCGTTRKDFFVTPLIPSKNNTFYCISSQDFKKVSLKDLLSDTTLIARISKEKIKKTNPSSKEIEDEEIKRRTPSTNKRMRALDLTKQESNYLFHKLFENYLISFIQKKDSAITDGRLEEATETTPFFDNNSSTSSSSAIKEFFAKMFCCGS